MLPQEALQSSKSYNAIKPKFKPSPDYLSTQDGISLFYSAHGMPVYFRGNDQRLGKMSGLANAFNVVQPQNYEPGIAKELDAAVLRVRCVVDIAKQTARGGLMGPASVTTKAELSVMPTFTEFMFITPSGKTAVLTLAKYVNAAESILELKKAGKSDYTVPDLSALGGPAGGGGALKVGYALVTTADDYTRVVRQHLDAVEAMFLSAVKGNR